MKPIPMLKTLCLALPLVVVACGSNDPTASTNGALDVNPASVKYWVGYSLTGAIQVDHTIGEIDEGRIACTLVLDPTSNAPMLVMSADANYGEKRAPGLYFKLQSFHGAGSYTLDAAGAPGLAYAYESSNLEDCTRNGDTSCYGATSGCTFIVDTWDFSSPDPEPGTPPEVKWGRGVGRFSCASMTNSTSQATIALVDGTFVCRAADWSAVSQAN